MDRAHRPGGLSFGVAIVMRRLPGVDSKRDRNRCNEISHVDERGRQSRINEYRDISTCHGRLDTRWNGAEHLSGMGCIRI